VFFHDDFSAEDLHSKWRDVTSFENARHATLLSESKNGFEERLGGKLVLVPQKK
jgi:hypothetical protein